MTKSKIHEMLEGDLFCGSRRDKALSLSVLFVTALGGFNKS